MTAIPVTIGNEIFPTLTAATARCSALLGSGGVDDKITDPADVNLLHALFHSRPEKIAELGKRRIVGWGRKPTAIDPGKCFAAILSDGEKLDFSFHKSIKALREDK